MRKKAAKLLGMSKNNAAQSMTSERIRAIQERRRSNAAGTHGKRFNRRGEKTRAIRDSKDN